MPSILQRFPDDFFGRLTVEANEHAVRASYSSLTQSWEQDWCEYSKVNPNPVIWQAGNSAWSSIAWGLLSVGLAISLLVDDKFRRLLIALFMFLALGIFLQRFVRRKYLAFYTVGGGHLFTLRLPGGREVAEFIIEKSRSSHATVSKECNQCAT